MSATATLARAGLIVSAAFLLSRVLGYVRGSIMGAVFGLEGLDAFYAAFRLPDLMFQLVAAGALSAALVPIVSGLLATDEQARAWRIVSTVATLVLVALLVLSVLFFVAAPIVVPLIANFEAAAEVERTIELTRIMLLSPILLALGAVASSALNARGRFAAAAIAPSVYNVGIIVGAAVLAPALGETVDGVRVPNPVGLALGVVLGSLGHVLVQLKPLAALGFRFQPHLGTEDPLARRALALMAPRAIGLGASQITFVAITALATGPGRDGWLSAFNLGMLLLQIPLGVIGVPLGIVLLPALSRELATGGIEPYLGLVGRALRLVLFVMLPIAALGMVLRVEVVDLLFRYAEFDRDAVLLTASALLLFLAGLAAHALIAVLARAFYAGQDTRTPVAAALAAVVVNIVVAVLAVGPFGLPGLAFAIAAGAWLEASVLFAILWRRHRDLDAAGLGRTLGRAAIAAVVAGGIALATLAVLDGPLPVDAGKVAVFGRAVIAAGTGALGYLAMSLALRAPELPALVGVATDLLRRRRAA